MDSERPSKQEAFRALLREGWTSLHLDSRHPGVILPAALRDLAHLVLQYGYDLPIPIPDLTFDEDGVRATLSFARSPHFTDVPWDAVYAIACHDGRGVLYQEDVPEDVAVVPKSIPGELTVQPPDAFVPSPEPAPPPRGERMTPRGPLRSVPSAEGLEAMAFGGDEPARRRRPQLRLVK